MNLSDWTIFSTFIIISHLFLQFRTYKIWPDWDTANHLYFGFLLKNGININSWMVRTGHALAYRKYSKQYVLDENFAKDLSKLGDLYINEAFSCSHRKQASLHNITKFIDSYGGPLLKKEIQSINLIFQLVDINSCLLYTSPSPRDRTRSRMPSSA